MISKFLFAGLASHPLHLVIVCDLVALLFNKSDTHSLFLLSGPLSQKTQYPNVTIISTGITVAPLSLGLYVAK